MHAKDSFSMAPPDPVNTERQQRLIARRQEGGDTRITIWLSGTDKQALREQYPGPCGGIDWQTVIRAALQGTGHA
jgi:hypothetical protein